MPWSPARNIAVAVVTMITDNNIIMVIILIIIIIMHSKHYTFVKPKITPKQRVKQNKTQEDPIYTTKNTVFVIPPVELFVSIDASLLSVHTYTYIYIYIYLLRNVENQGTAK